MKIQLLAVTVLLALATQAKAERAYFLYHDQEAIQARADLIQQAKKEILVEYFAVTDDAVSTGGIGLLCEASKRGVQVKILLDGLSSHVKETTMGATQLHCKDKLGKTNIEFRLFNPWDITKIMDVMSRDHDKMLAVDGKAMIIGGRNVDAKYFGLDKTRHYKDLDILISGKVVKEARDYYLALWDKKDIVKKVDMTKLLDPDKLRSRCLKLHSSYCLMGVEMMIKKFKKETNAAATRMNGIVNDMRTGKGYVKWNTGKDWLVGGKEIDGVRLLSTSPKKNVGVENKNISDDLHTLFKGARNNVLILTPYMIPTKRAEAMFEDLIRRGVKVTVITNSLKTTDNLFAQAGYESAKDKLIELGVELYEYNLADTKTTHAKTAVIDDEIALIGTYNLDPRSSQINREIGLAIHDTKGSGIAKDLTTIINKFKKESLLVGRDGKHVNKYYQNRGVSPLRKNTVDLIEKAVPLIKNQL